MALVDENKGIWRIGFTKFATRMLGELVEAEFEIPVGDVIEPGQEIGWVEGFKAASCVYSVMKGTFLGMNPALDEDACIIRSSPYTDGYLYEVNGTPETGNIDVAEYEAHLDALIEEMKKDPKYADT
jgi:glycine cleavage system H protein